ncbi:MAG TPA: protein kinase [Thermoanaerobaculia bacterium]|nr:protein kinase [Thermoanaerobaculia bacterium]
MNLGRYEVVRELGKGAMGIVYLAKDPLIGRMVALKTIRLTDSGDEEEVREFQQRFLREAQAAGILSHAAIVTVHDIGQDDHKGVSFIAMEYVEGPTLKEVIQQGKQMSYSATATIMSQVADALDYAHTKGITHRDVKPANIILCGDEKVKITDFGIAKIATDAANLTTTGQFLGTPNYMAPEQVKGAPVDGRTDIFSLGVVLYECLTRRKPFGGDSLTTISYRIVHEPFESPHEFDPAIPETFDAVISRCLAKDPKDRYQRAREVAADLRALAAGQPLPPPVLEPIADATVVSMRIPTIENPFPDADAPPRSQETATPTRTGSITFVPPASLRKKVSAPLFIGIVGLMLLGLIGVAGWIWSQRSSVPPVDTRREALVNQQRELRTEGMALLQQGNVEGAYQKFAALRKIAPASPGVSEMLSRLEQVRGQQEVEAQQKEEALAKFNEAKTLYDARRFDRAIPLFEEAFNLDPSLSDAVSFIAMSREQMALRQLSEAQKMAAKKTEPVTVRTASGEPASLSVTFQSALTDGYIMIQADGQKILQENIFEDSRRGILRRRIPRSVNTTQTIPAGQHEVIVWVVVPSIRVTERKVFNQNFRAGNEYRISIRWNESARQFIVDLSS